MILYSLPPALARYPCNACNGFSLDNVERGPLTVTRRRAREQGADRANRLAVAPNDSPDVALPHLQPENR